MRTTLCVVAILLGSFAGDVFAQEPAPFVGHFVDATTGEAELLLVPAAPGTRAQLEGVLFEGANAAPRRLLGVVRDGVLEARGPAREDGEPGARVTIRAVPDGLVVERDGEEVRFDRVPGSSTDATELRAVLRRLLPPAKPKPPLDERGAFATLERLARAQAAFREADDDGDQVADFGTLAELAAAGRIDEALAGGEWRGYRFALRVSPDAPGERWMATAMPVQAGRDWRSLVVNHDGVVHVTKTVAPLTDDCAIPPGAVASTVSFGPDLSHVRAGQRYRYALRNPGAPDMFMSYRVLAVEGETVKYEIVTFMDLGQGLQPIGEPVPQEWRYEAPPADVPAEQGGPKVELSRESVTISGVTFDCMVVETGGTKSWVPATGDVPTFPGLIKTMTDGKVTMELVAIGE